VSALSDTTQVILIAAGLAAAVGVIGLVLAQLTRRSSLRWSFVIVALSAVVGVIAGIVGTARAMFLSQHDFEVTLSFNKMPETIRIPFLAIRRFSDPSVEFGFQFQSPPAATRAGATALQPKPEAPLPAVVEEQKKVAGDEPAQVVSLDAFRKK